MLREGIESSLIAGMDKNDLVLLKFTEEEKERLEWEHSREFEFKGEMFDVMETSVTGDTTFYWCWEDNEETTLNEQIASLVNDALGNDRKNKKNCETFNSFLKSLYFSPISKTNFFRLQDLKVNSLFRIEFYTSLTTIPPLPPPKLLC